MRSSMRTWLIARPTRFFAISRSACRGSTEAKALRLGSLALFSRFHVPAQHGVHRGLVTATVLAKERKHVGIDAQGNLLFWSRPDYRVLEEIRAELGRVGKIYVLIAHRVDALPISLCWLFRIPDFHELLPF